VNVGLPDGTEDGTRIMSIQDMNNDKLNDLVTMDTTGATITVYYFDDSNSMYSSESSFDLPSGWFTDSIIPTNSASPLQNLIVIASNGEGWGTTLETRMFYFEQSAKSSGTDLVNKYTWKQTSSDLDNIELMAGSQPMALDINSDQA